MHEKLREGATGRLARNHRRQIWKRVVSVLACVVVFCTTYALILPALTAEKTSFCGKDEHIHSEACYARIDAKSVTAPASTHESETAAASTHESETAAASTHESETAAASTHESETASAADLESPAVQKQTDGSGSTEQSGLVCSHEEHTHSLACFSNPEADVETVDIWEATLPEELPQKWVEAVVAVAESQIGYIESEKNYMVAEAEEMKGYTRYGEWSGDPYGDWDTAFLAFCLHYAGVTEEVFPMETSCDQWIETLQKEEYNFYHTKEAYEPKAGDLVFFDTDGDRTADHVGLVAELLAAKETEAPKLRTIEGDLENSVRHADYELTDEQILGYALLPEQQTSETAETTEPETTAASEQANGHNIQSGHIDETEPKQTEETGDSKEYANNALQVAAEGVGYALNPSEITVPHHSFIDAFSDEDENPDTTLDNRAEDKKDLHRLYLTVEPPQMKKPMDLLLVLDNSGSMFNLTANRQYRYSAMNDALKEFIPQFLSACEGNRIGIVYYSGPLQDYTSADSVPENVTDGVLSDDAWTACEWNSDASTVVGSLLEQCRNASTNNKAGTNYAAGLAEAKKLLNDSDSEHDVSMVFLSDGIPTHYINGEQRGGNGLSVEEQSRYSWRQKATTNENNCKQPTLNAVSDFRNSYPNLPIYAISFSSSMASESANYALAAMDDTYTHTESKEGLSEIFNQFLPASVGGISGITISDTLSEYVDLYETQPDVIQPGYKVSMKTVEVDENGKKKIVETVLCDEDGKPQGAGIGKLKEVTYDKDTKTVKAIFEDSYTLEQGYTYTLSFNVKTTQKAYQEYADLGNTYPPNTTGAPGTDYGNNTTSSNKAGFYTHDIDTNDNAKVKAALTYKIGDGSPISEAYPNPVVRVALEPIPEPDERATITAHKTIDAFRDGAPNPDTDLDDKTTDDKTEFDLYRLYLDAQVSEEREPVDLLIVIDQSGSMHKNYTSDYEWDAALEKWVPIYVTTEDETPDVLMYKDMFDGDTRLFRDEAVRLVLNGTYNRDEFDSKKSNGIVSRFLALHPENNIAVVSFQGRENIQNGETVEEYKYDNKDSSILLPWTHKAQYIDTNGILANSTNYCAGMVEAGTMLNQVKDNGHKKLMLFLSDGAPTVYLENDMAGTCWRKGQGYVETQTAEGRKKLETYRSTSNAYFADLMAHHPELKTYTIGIASFTSDNADVDSPVVLKQMAENGGGEFFKGTTTEKLREYINHIIDETSYTSMAIQDTLSEYVDVHPTQPDYKVTMKKEGEPEIVLYKYEYDENGNGKGVITPEGEDRLENVTYDPDTRKVSAVFKANYRLDMGYTYTLSFNIKTKDETYPYYEANGYSDTGDPGTDYGRNTTSSNQPGYHSNKIALLKYKYKDETYKIKYPHPVVQVRTDPPQTPDEPGTVTYHKTIDALREGSDNKDTTLDNTVADKTDLYRLYLDAQLPTMNPPVDLLIVVDQSGSMHKDYEGSGDPADYMDMQDEDGTTPIFRDQAVRLVLNGTYSNDQNIYEQKKENGLIYQFLSLNPKNKVAVVGFQGGEETWGAGNKYPDTNPDSAELLGWTNEAKNILVNGQEKNGTNYCAGLLKADDMLDQVKDDGNKKIMLFLSDGMPTLYLIGPGDKWIPNELFPWLGHNEHRDYVWRDGTGNSMDAKTEEMSKTYFENLMNKYPDLVTHTIGISKDVNPETGTDAEGTASNVVLKYMAEEKGHGIYEGANTTKGLRDVLRHRIFDTACTQLVIEDTLSQYVDYYTAQPDLKVTMKRVDGSEIVLYDKAPTAEGEGILQSVGYDPATGKVSAVFVPTYKLEYGATYTLSFNVETNQEAYKEYAKNGYSGVTGDENTDYGDNATSSGKGGFHSNHLAKMSYNDGTNTVEKEYLHPVVQAVTCKVAVEKTDSTVPGKKLSGAKFTLYRKALEGETGESLATLEGSFIKQAERCITDENGQLVIDNLIPGEYWLVETKAPENYHQLKDPIPFTLTRSTDGSGQIAGSSEVIEIGGEKLPSLTVPNEPWEYELPETGGPGTDVYTIGGLLLMLAGLLLLYKKNKCGKEDFASF